MESDNDTSAALGRWAGGDFGATVSLYRGVGVDTDVPDQHRFVSGVVQLLRQRRLVLEAQDDSDDSDLAIFVLKPMPPDSITTTREPMLDHGHISVVGRLWFSSVAVTSAHYVNLPQDSDDARVSYVADRLDLGALPTLIFDPRTVPAKLRWYPEGLGQLDNVDLIPLSGDLSPSEVFDLIEHLYRQCFVTPDSLPNSVSLWHDASRYRPLENAEALVQSHLKTGLAARFPSCKIRHEQTQVTGRTDLEIEQFDSLDHSVVTRHAIIELKVLRSFRSSGSKVYDSQTKESIEEGVRQAAAYRIEKEARWSALCCFDMRRDDAGDEACFADVQDCADALEVMLRRWFLYASAAELRQAITSRV